LVKTRLFGNIANAANTRTFTGRSPQSQAAQSMIILASGSMRKQLLFVSAIILLARSR
jgi:hypothetical protein